MSVLPVERLTFPSAGRALIAYLHRPGAPGPWPAVVLNHGSDLTQNSLPGVAHVLATAGYLAFTAIRRGYGDSPGPTRLDEVTAPVGQPGHGDQVCARLLAESDDVLAALRFLRPLPEVDRTRIAVMGSSYGGINSLLAASRDPDVRCCVSFAAAAMTWPHVPEVREFLLRHADAIRCPVLLLQAENDFDLTPSLALAERLRMRGRICERHLFRPFGIDAMEGHRIFVYAPQIWAPVVLPFLARHLGGAHRRKGTQQRSRPAGFPRNARRPRRRPGP
ncbi:MAG TPA: alpha/beta fold hydrolase [bacterium]|nr:alpha/beta fold hydrolase [bacterium]